MKEIGYPLTWTTHCFLLNGCGAKVFAHTNGGGDFVLFDELGPPWPVRECYLHRIRKSWALDEHSGSSFDEILSRVRAQRDTLPAIEAEEREPHRQYELPVIKLEQEAQRQYEREAPMGPHLIEPVSAIEYLSNGNFKIVGYVQSIVENAVQHQIEKLRRRIGGSSTLAERQLTKIMGGRGTQITIVDRNFRSFTVFANVSNMVLSISDSLVLTLKAHPSPLPQSSGRHRDIRLLWPFFVCESVQRMPR